MTRSTLSASAVGRLPWIQHEIFMESVRHVAKLCAVAAMAAARSLGVIQADLAVALSMSVSHKNIFFDKKMPEIKFPA
jgi:uncharacterized protein YifN (PemK superfamily)